MYDIWKELSDVWKNRIIQNANTEAVAEDQEETDQMILMAEGKHPPGRSAYLGEEEVLAFLAYPSA
jgi:hypothetical protein